MHRHLGIFALAEPTFANIYVGLAQRAIDLAIAGHRVSFLNGSRTKWTAEARPITTEVPVRSMAEFTGSTTGRRCRPRATTVAVICHVRF